MALGPPASRRGPRWPFVAGGALLLVALVATAMLLTRQPTSVAAGPSPSASVDARPSATGEPAASPALGEPFGRALEVRQRACGEDLDCSIVTVPLDHADPVDGEAIEVRFGLHEADAERRIGTLVVATGGPGSSGIELSDFYLTILPERILDRYDIVFFEQRGVGRSAPVRCPVAAVDEPDWADLAGTSIQEALTVSRSWTEECLAEAGVDGPEALDAYATFQAAADLDAYLDHLGAGEVIVFGESYGTKLALTYAAHRPERVAGLILDAVVDPTLGTVQTALEQAEAFGEVLTEVLAWCAEDEVCADDFGDAGAPAAWDALAERLRDGPFEVELHTRSGETKAVELTLSDFVLTSASLLYSEADRSLLLRALASAARDDLGPLVRLAALTWGTDPETGRPLTAGGPDPAAFYAISCQSAGSDEAEPEALRDGVARLADGGGRMAEMALSNLACYAGFAGRAEPPVLPAAFTDADFPVLVLTSTADPATPTAWSESVAERFADAYLIVTEGGGHGTFGWGLPCPDGYVLDFLAHGDLPDDDRIECDGELTSWYTPLPLGGPDAYPSVLDALVAVEEELFMLPDYIYWDGATRRIGCPYGGRLEMSWRGSPMEPTDTFELTDCALLPDWPTSGTVTFDAGETTMSLELPNGTLEYESTATWEVTVTGVLDGVEVDLSR